jgi:hypothetical protein
LGFYYYRAIPVIFKNGGLTTLYFSNKFRLQIMKYIAAACLLSAVSGFTKPFTRIGVGSAIAAPRFERSSLMMAA